MRAFLITILFSIHFFGFSQNFVSPGIIAFHSGAYERTIEDMDKAFQANASMDDGLRSKAHYYRGMARLNLVKAGSNSQLIGQDPYLSIYNDLSRASQLDSQWSSSAQAEMNLIYNQLFSGAKQLYDQGIYAATEQEVSRLLGGALTKLNTAVRVRNNFEVNDLLGQTHDAIGIFYDQLIDDPTAQTKALDSYRTAMQFYEAALTINPRSLSSIRALKQLAYRLGERNKEIQYAQMEENLGG